MDKEKAGQIYQTGFVTFASPLTILLYLLFLSTNQSSPWKILGEDPLTVALDLKSFQVHNGLRFSQVILPKMLPRNSWAWFHQQSDLFVQG